MTSHGEDESSPSEDLGDGDQNEDSPDSPSADEGSEPETPADPVDDSERASDVDYSNLVAKWASLMPPDMKRDLFRGIRLPVFDVPRFDIPRINIWKSLSNFDAAQALALSIPKFEFPGLYNKAIFDPAPFMRAIWADSYDFSGLRAQLGALGRGLQRFQFPPNLARIDGVSFEKIGDVAEEGIPLYRVPRTRIAAALLNAPREAARRKILGRNVEKILDDCDDTLDLCISVETRSGVLFTRSAISAARAGHFEAAQALAANTLDTLISTQLPHSDGVKRGHFKGANRSKRETLDSLQVRWFLVALPIWHAHREFSGGTTGSGIPRNYNRHATVHGVSRRQYSKRNTVTALMANTGFIALLNGL
jgi:hypothetical protein